LTVLYQNVRRSVPYILDYIPFSDIV